MPYIPSCDRGRFAEGLTALKLEIDKNGISNGEFNYLISKIANMYIRHYGLSYNTGSDVIKAFECAKLEFYRCIMAPYEDRKNYENGPVYTFV